MFTRKPDRGVLRRTAGAPPPLSAPAPGRGQQAAASGIVSVIGPDLAVTGNLETTGEVQVLGDVQGDISAKRIVVTEQGRVMGDLLADEVIVGGAVQGSIRANNLTLRSGSHIEGDMYHRNLSIERGAYFEGKSRRTENPMAVRLNPNGGPPLR
jgi:cytoskeletal protein CcmA (bactofilin family)